MTQLNLWDAPQPASANTPGLARKSAPQTSRAAAQAIASASGSIRMRVLEYIERLGPSGATCDEVEAELGLRHQTAAARLRELETGGYVYTDGKRPTRSGCNAQIYRVTQQGMDAVRGDA